MGSSGAPARVIVAEGRGILPERSHGSEGTQRRVIREVDDPINGKTRMVVGYVRPGGVEDMWARGRLSERQKAAADKFAELYEIAHTDGVAAIDYSKLRVDGSMGDLSTGERVVRAIKQLQRAQQVIGTTAYALVKDVVGERQSFRDLARAAVAVSGGNLNYKAGKLGEKLVKALDALDAHWNVAVGGGVGVRSTGHVAGEVQVKTAAVDKFEGWSEEELAAHTYNVGESLKRMASPSRVKPKAAAANQANDNRKAAKIVA